MVSFTQLDANDADLLTKHQLSKIGLKQFSTGKRACVCSRPLPAKRFQKLKGQLKTSHCNTQTLHASENEGRKS